jgi:hypothetical protein
MIVRINPHAQIAQALRTQLATRVPGRAYPRELRNVVLAYKHARRANGVTQARITDEAPKRRFWLPIHSSPDTIETLFDVLNDTEIQEVVKALRGIGMPEQIGRDMCRTVSTLLRGVA